MFSANLCVAIGAAGMLVGLSIEPRLAQSQERTLVIAPEKTITQGGVVGIAFGDDNKTLAAALSVRDYVAIGGHTLRYPVVLYNAETGKEKHALGSHPNIVTTLAFVDKGLNLLTGCTPLGNPRGASLITRWGVRSGLENASAILPDGGAVKAISKDGKLAVTARGYPQTVARVWEIESEKEIASLDGGAEMFDVSCAAFAPDGKAIAIGGGKNNEGAVQLWSGESYKEKRQQAAAAKARFISFSPKGDLLVSCSTAFNRLPPWGDLEIWQYPSGKLLPFQLDYHREYCQFTPDGRHLAVGFLSRIELWNIRTGKLAAKFTGPEPRYVELFAFSPDGKSLAGVSERGQIVLWKVPKLDD